MRLFTQEENKVKCGKCGTEFDLAKNKDFCPLCGFGKSTSPVTNDLLIKAEKTNTDLLVIPTEIRGAPKGNPVLDYETRTMGLWGMFNGYFPGKAVLRICANLIASQQRESVTLKDLVEATKSAIRWRKLDAFKGFPKDLESESAIGRLVHHFIGGYYNLGLFEVNFLGKEKKGNVWLEKWENIQIRPTKEGLEFAKLRNRLFDDRDYGKGDQILTSEEKKWLIDYLQKLDAKGFKEYSWLRDVYLFIKSGRNGKHELYDWFKKNPRFVKYVKDRSSKADNQREFEKQLSNLAQMFASSKVSLLRELGVIRNKRNDYTIIGDLE